MRIRNYYELLGLARIVLLRLTSIVYNTLRLTKIVFSCLLSPNIQLAVVTVKRCGNTSFCTVTDGDLGFITAGCRQDTTVSRKQRKDTHNLEEIQTDQIRYTHTRGEPYDIEERDTHNIDDEHTTKTPTTQAGDTTPQEEKQTTQRRLTRPKKRYT